MFHNIDVKITGLIKKVEILLSTNPKVSEKKVARKWLLKSAYTKKQKTGNEISTIKGSKFKIFCKNG